MPIKPDMIKQPAKRKKSDSGVLIGVDSIELADGTSKPWLALNGFELSHTAKKIASLFF